MEVVRSTDGTPIAFERIGGGPPVILVGGALGGRSAGHELAAALASSCTAIAFDRRGRGDSGDTPPYAVGREVEDVAALIEAAGGTASIYGHSSGAVLGLEVARTLGAQAVPGLVVYEPPFVVDESRPAVPADAAERVEALVAAGRRGDAVEYFLRTAPLVPPEQVREMRSSPSWADFVALAHTLAYDFGVTDDTTGGSAAPLRRFASVAAPTLVLTGGASPGWFAKGADALVDVLPRAERRVVEGQTHAVELAVIAPIVAAFVASTA